MGCIRMLFGKKPSEIKENEFSFTGGNKVSVEGAFLKTAGTIGFISVPLNKIETVSVAFQPPTNLNLKGLNAFTTEVRIVGCGVVLGELHAPYEQALEIQNWIMDKLPA
jgi:hypothetical protein